MALRSRSILGVSITGVQLEVDSHSGTPFSTSVPLCRITARMTSIPTLRPCYVPLCARSGQSIHSGFGKELPEIIRRGSFRDPILMMGGRVEMYHPGQREAYVLSQIKAIATRQPGSPVWHILCWTGSG